MILDENQLSSAHNIWNTIKIKSSNKQQKQKLAHNNMPKRLLLKASSYPSIGQCGIVTLLPADYRNSNYNALPSTNYENEYYQEESQVSSFSDESDF